MVWLGVDHGKQKAVTGLGATAPVAHRGMNSSAGRPTKTESNFLTTSEACQDMHESAKKKPTQNPKSQLILTVFCTLLNTHMHASNMAQINFVKAQDKRVIPSQPSSVGCLELKTRTIMRQTILGKAECFFIPS